MRTHVEFDLRKFIQQVEQQMLIRYLERFQESYAEEQGRESATVASVLSLVTEVGLTTGGIKGLVDMTRTPGPLARLSEGPLKCVNDLNCPRGRACLQRELLSKEVSIDPEMDPINAGMRLLLDYPDRMRRLLAIYQVEQTEDWRMFRASEPGEAQVSGETSNAIARDFSDALRDQGLSGQCEGTAYAQPERVVVEIAHEQYTEALREFRGGEIEVDWRKPVRHARLVYRPSTGLLKIKTFRNNGTLIAVLRRSAGVHLFGWQGQFFGTDAEATFDLSLLTQKPQWKTDPADQIDEVQVIGLDFACTGAGGATAQFRSTTTNGLYRMLGEFALAASGIDIHGAAIRFKFPAGEIPGCKHHDDGLRNTAAVAAVAQLRPDRGGVHH